MKEIKIALMDFWPNDGHFKLYDNVFINTISSMFYVTVDQENPDIIFYSLFGNQHNKEQYKKTVKVLFNGESYVSNYTKADYVIDIHKNTYENRIEQLYINKLSDRHCYMPLWLYDRDFPIFLGKSRSILMEEKHLNNTNILNDKISFCSFVASNSVPLREDVCKFISNNYKLIDCPGNCLHNTTEKLGAGFYSKYDYLYKRKFNLCFENRSKIGYCTEKIVDAFAAHTIPIYWGDPTITEIFNKDSFINANDCKKYSDILDIVKEVDKNDELYMKMLNTPALIDPTYPVKKLDEMKDFILNIVYNL